jgi:chloramphenicol-sensitive protein RarD
MDASRTQRDGLALGIGAYALWGLLPLYLKLLHGVGSGEVLAHRIVWSLLLLAILAVALGRAGEIRAAARGRTLLLLGLSAMLITINWIGYIWAILNGHALEGSLGYFINPMVNVALGVAVLGERIRPVQIAAVGIAVVGVALLAVANLLTGGGGAWWLSLLLPVSFGLYGLVRKVAAIDALGGLVVETLLLAPPALLWLLYAEWQGTAAFGHDLRLDLLLAAAGLVTAVPLLMFTGAARRLRYATLGLIQYILPTLVFFEAVLLFGEPLRTVQLVTFGLIWTGCALYAFDSVREARSVIGDDAVR